MSATPIALTPVLCFYNAYHKMGDFRMRERRRDTIMIHVARSADILHEFDAAMVLRLQSWSPLAGLKPHDWELTQYWPKNGLKEF